MVARGQVVIVLDDFRPRPTTPPPVPERGALLSEGFALLGSMAPDELERAVVALRRTAVGQRS
jgi:hypothetical protein